MTGALHLVALVAMVPAMLGPPHESRGTLALTLCGGGSIELNLPDDRPSAPKGDCTKGCHSGSNRKRIDRAQ